MLANTHNEISRRLCGEPLELAAGSAAVSLTTTDEMRVDDASLVHGGFVFGLADYAAMLAVNEPNVVLGSADTRFVSPVRVGDVLRASARVASVVGNRHVVTVRVECAERAVLTGTFTCFVTAEHVLGVGTRGAAR